MRQAVRDEPRSVKTVLGRTICTDCNNTTNGLAAGMLGAPATGADPVPQAILSQGIFRRLLRRKKSSGSARSGRG